MTQTTKADKHLHKGWEFQATTSRILKSDGTERTNFENQLELPHLPEMVFAQNTLSIRNTTTNHCLHFNALDALKMVAEQQEDLLVARSQAWKDARSACEHINKKFHSFDWTFSTDYSGTLEGDFNIQETEEEMDREMLLKKENIIFYTDIPLYEDELHDCGCSLLTVKIRVMDSLFLVLLRFYLRVDDVIVRLCETRVFHEFGKDYFLREFVKKEGKFPFKNVEPSAILDGNLIADHLQVTFRKLHKIKITS